MPVNRLVVAGLLVLATSRGVAQFQPEAEATSLLGRPLVAGEIPAEQRATLEANLAAARAEYDRSPENADAIIWLGRRTAYLGRYRAAIAVFSDGIRKHPGDARMYRHRGHRYITVRELHNAIADLSKAAALVSGRPDEVEPDGQPNARNIPTSTRNSNIYYHLGLAHYLSGNFSEALDAYRECLRYSKNPDALVAITHWLYMTLRRLDRPGEARAVLEPITPTMEIRENGSYHKLLMLYKGVETADALTKSTAGGGLDSVTIGYGVANWHLYNGRWELAVPILREIVEKHSTQWPAFGYIAAEAELARDGIAKIASIAKIAKIAGRQSPSTSTKSAIQD